MLDKGVYFPPAQFEAAFVSAAHTPLDISQTVRAIGAFENVPASHGR
jgi:glutamate-1-semialdehyde 2,1-aminomutase